MALYMRFAQNEYYHIYNRGVESRDIFLNTADYKRFLNGLLAFNTDIPMTLRKAGKLELAEILSLSKLTSIISYALMKNHVHFLVRCNDENNLAKFLQKLFVGYTMYFNTKYQRKGVLFESGSKSKHISDHRYLARVVNYIHLNPLDYTMPEWRKHGIKSPTKAQQLLMDYPFSSIRGILKLKDDPIIDINLINELFPNPKELLASMLDWSSEIFDETGDFLIE